MAYIPWLTAASEIRDALYELSDNVLEKLWLKCRPELVLWTPTDRTNINRKGWLMGTTGYVQNLRTKQFISKCHVEMEAQWYNLEVVVRAAERVGMKIIVSRCSCAASRNLGDTAFCKHVIALFYAVEKVIDGGEIPEWNLPCTSFGQTWGVPVVASRTGELRSERADVCAHFLRPDRRATWNPGEKSRIHPEDRLFSRDRMVKARQFVEDNPDIFPPSFLRAIEDPDQCLRLPRGINPPRVNFFCRDTSWPASYPTLPIAPVVNHGCSCKDNALALDSATKQYFCSVVLHTSPAVLEKQTRNQSSSAERVRQRSMRITSTFVKRVTTGMKNKAALREGRLKKLAGDIVAPRDLSKIPAIKRGRELEPEACAAFSQELAGKGLTVEMVPIGFVVHFVERWAAASPDRLLRLVEETVESARFVLLEVKTFASRKGLEGLPYLKPTALDDGGVAYSLKPTHEHYFQVQWEMFCTGLTECYFYAYSEDGQCTFLEHVSYDASFLDPVTESSLQFYFSYLLPLLEARDK